MRFRSFSSVQSQVEKRFDSPDLLNKSPLKDMEAPQLKPPLGGIQNLFHDATDEMKVVIGPQSENKEKVTISERVKEVAEEVKQKFEQTAAPVKEKAQHVVSTLKQEIPESTREKISSSTASLKEMAGSVSDKVKQVVQNPDRIKDQMKTVMGSFESMKNQTIDTIIKAKDSVKVNMEHVKESIPPPIVKGTFQQVSEKATEWKDKAAQTGKEYLEQVKDTKERASQGIPGNLRRQPEFFFLPMWGAFLGLFLFALWFKSANVADAGSSVQLPTEKEQQQPHQD